MHEHRNTHETQYTYTYACIRNIMNVAKPIEPNICLQIHAYGEAYRNQQARMLSTVIYW